MPLDAPFQLGPFRIDESGGLALARPDSQPRFHITWHGSRVTVELRAEAAGGTLVLEAEPGRVPSTAASDPAPDRMAVFNALHGLKRTLPPGWALALQPDHRVAVRASRALAMPTSAAALLTEVTVFLLVLAPYLDLLAEVGVEPAVSGPPGTAKTWPG